MIGSAITLFSEYHRKQLSKQLWYWVVSDECVQLQLVEREEKCFQFFVNMAKIWTTGNHSHKSFHLGSKHKTNLVPKAKN